MIEPRFFRGHHGLCRRLHERVKPADVNGEQAVVLIQAGIQDRPEIEQRGVVDQNVWICCRDPSSARVELGIIAEISGVVGSEDTVTQIGRCRQISPMHLSPQGAQMLRRALPNAAVAAGDDCNFAGQIKVLKGGGRRHGVISPRQRSGPEPTGAV